MKKLLAEILGWYGAVAIILAYALVSFYTITSSSVIYQILNLTGSLGLLAIALVKRVYQPVVLNVIWAIIALVALLPVIF